MGGYITNKQEKFPSIYIAPIVDNTERFELSEAGAMCGVGYWDVGNPNFAINISHANTRLKSTVPLMGGNIKNETAYHVNDHINVSNARVLMARILGSTSTLKQVNCDGAVLAEGAEVNIFGADNIGEWLETSATLPLEILPTICPQNSVVMDVDFTLDDGLIEIKLFDDIGNILYQVIGHYDPTHVDDYNDSDYIGTITDPNYISIKTIPTDVIYDADFSATKSFIAGLVTDAGVVNNAQLETVLNQVTDKSDYVASMGVRDIDILKMLITQGEKASISIVIDVHATTVDLADAFVDNFLSIADGNVYFVWDRGQYKFRAGVQDVGISGWITGQNVKRNLSQIKGFAEYRISGIAGVNFPIDRVLSGAINELTDEEKTLLTKLRINTIEMRRGSIVLSDVLSSSRRNTDLQSFPVADALRYINRTIARIEEGQLFKNIQVAKSFIAETTGRFFRDCRSNAYFDSDIPLADQIKYEVTDENNDTVVVSYTAYMEGVMRKGAVRSTIKRKGY